MPLPRNQLLTLKALTERADEISASDLSSAAPGLSRSSLYAAAAALQRRGRVTARWDVTGQYPRRVFKLTREGRRLTIEELQRYAMPDSGGQTVPQLAS